MIDPEISVIVPVYNAQNFLEDCIDSVLAQTYQNFELILVDDGSTDRSSEICDRYAEKDIRVQVIHQVNQGQATARNRALMRARGNWVCFVDSDDLIHPQMLELLYNAVYQSSLNMSMCGYVESDVIPSDFYSNYDKQFVTLRLDESVLVEMLSKDQYPSWVVWCKLFRREIIMQNLFTEGRVYEDNAVVCRWVYNAESAAVVPYDMYFYRINPQGTTKSSFSLKQLDYLWALQEILTFFAEIEYKKLHNAFCELYVVSAAVFYRTVIDQLNRKDIAKKIKRDMLSVLVQNRADLKLSTEKQEEIIGNLHPKIMPIYWMIERAYLIVKQDGIFILIKKVFERLK